MWERLLQHAWNALGGPEGELDRQSAFHRTADGWLRLHANYPWHRVAALRVPGCDEATGPEALAAAVRRWRSVELETALHEAGGVAAAVRTEQEWWATEAGRAARSLPLVERRDLGPAAPRPERRPRVLDLTRVIAGPVATRTLAVHGAEVLRLDAPDRPEIPLQYWDTLPGKRSALLDLGAEGGRLEGLLTGADVVVTAYRPGALDRFGLEPEKLAARHPGLVVVTLSAWGHLGPWAGRRGFDSLVQAATGIGVAEAGGDRTRRPGALPAQVLDHATGHLGAAAALLALAGQRRTRGTPHVRLSLVVAAAWLLDQSRADPTPKVTEVDPAPYLENLDAPDGRLTLTVPPGTVAGHGLRWPDPLPRSARRRRPGSRYFDLHVRIHRAGSRGPDRLLLPSRAHRGPARPALSAGGAAALVVAAAQALRPAQPLVTARGARATRPVASR
ncbi:CoA transferase [Pseudonocardia sp. H11422]|uniref:CoA transferase n=1 Tax=Pseudonocardia sp. H11422 TaxID=2835866 RepID=UPI001BDD87B6|nr:CoA transferase [Pseudonocardia sp. H11422]